MNEWGDGSRYSLSSSSSPSRSPHHHAGCSSLREAESDCSLHRLLLTALRLRLRAALAGAAVPPQTLQLPDQLPVPVSALGRASNPALLLLLQGLCHRQRTAAVRFLAALLFPRLPTVFHTHPNEPLLRTGEKRGVGPVSNYTMTTRGGRKLSRCSRFNIFGICPWSSVYAEGMSKKTIRIWKKYLFFKS